MFQMKLPFIVHADHCCVQGLRLSPLFFSFPAPTTFTIIRHPGDTAYIACGKLLVHIYAGTEVTALLSAWLNAVLQKMESNLASVLMSIAAVIKKYSK
jgi:hypothetical protein